MTSPNPPQLLHIVPERWPLLKRGPKPAMVRVQPLPQMQPRRLLVRQERGRRGGIEWLSSSNTTRCDGCGSWERSLRAPAHLPVLRVYCSRCLPFRYESVARHDPLQDQLVTAILAGDVAELRAHRKRLQGRHRKAAARRWLQALGKVRSGEWKLTRGRRRALERAGMTR